MSVQKEDPKMNCLIIDDRTKFNTEGRTRTSTERVREISKSFAESINTHLDTVIERQEEYRATKFLENNHP